MMRSRSFLLWLALAVGIPLTCVGIVLLVSLSSWVYTTSHLRAARAAGVFASAEDGMLALIAKGYVIQPDEIQIVQAGTNSFDGSSPHVWYVTACVWGGERADRFAVGNGAHDYDQPGSYFLNTKEGWVHVSEGAFPELVGFWMKAFGMAGPGSAQATHEWGSSPRRGCVR
jgi:hypothetical protein